ncbi:MAG TPA: hypothetical protein EYN91_03040 [Candidatus Melainabacteria bacterium]|jgi:hypothetical protein|nr:hypothetical protein [Candidatus Melainabacteria bacterium]
MSKDDLAEQLGYAQSLGMPVGQVLVASGFLTKQEMLAAIQAQSLLLSGKITQDAAIKIIRDIVDEGSSLQAALATAGVGPEVTQSQDRLGELLVASELLSEENLAEALIASAELSSPLGHSLVKMQIIRPDLVVAALTVQKQLRQREISYEEALGRLKSAMKFRQFYPAD